MRYAPGMPAERLTSQDLIYAATALRQSARTYEKRAADPAFHSCRETFLHTMRVNDDLAAKLDRIAKCMKG